MKYHRTVSALGGFFLAAALGTGAFGEETPAAAPPQPSKASHPKFLSGPEAEFPDAAKAAGEFGKVAVSGTIGVDGKLHDAKVTLSSNSALLDASALTAANAAVFEPAHDAQGAAIAVPANIPYDFSNAKSPGKGGGALRYKCDQFVRDYDWWYKTWPADKHDDFYLMVLGYSSLAQSQHAGGGVDLSKFADSNEDFNSRWHKTVEECRKTPDKLFIDVIEPEGPFLRRLAGG
jgi:TonB family protein